MAARHVDHRLGPPPLRVHQRGRPPRVRHPRGGSILRRAATRGVRRASARADRVPGGVPDCLQSASLGHRGAIVVAPNLAGARTGRRPVARHPGGAQAARAPGTARNSRQVGTRGRVRPREDRVRGAWLYEPASIERGRRGRDDLAASRARAGRLACARSAGATSDHGEPDAEHAQRPHRQRRETPVSASRAERRPSWRDARSSGRTPGRGHRGGVDRRAARRQEPAHDHHPPLRGPRPLRPRLARHSPHLLLRRLSRPGAHGLSLTPRHQRGPRRAGEGVRDARPQGHGDPLLRPLRPARAPRLDGRRIRAWGRGRRSG